MSYPSQISRETVLEKALDLLEIGGVENLSLNKLAAELGVKAPSLYRYFNSKAELLKAINMATVESLVETMRSAAVGEDPVETAQAMTRAYREFAKKHPASYSLAFGTLPEEMQPDHMYMEALALPLQAVMSKIVGHEDSLPMLRGVWALVHGFVMLEISEQFRRGGSVDEAFEKAVRSYIHGWKQGRADGAARPRSHQNSASRRSG